MVVPVSPDERHREGLSLLRAGRLQEAVSAFNDVLRQAPLSVPARMGLAEACLRCNDGWTAVAWLSDACRVAPQEVGVWLELIGLLARQDRHSELTSVLESAAALHPGEPRFLEPLAEHHLRCGNHARAVELYRRLAALDAHHSGTQLHLGYALEHVGEIDDAIAHYRQALALSPELVEAHVDLAGVLWRVGDFDGALHHAQRAVALAPDSAYAQRILGTALLHLNRLAPAEAQLRHAIELRPDLFMARFDLALLLLLAGRLEEGWAAYAQRWDEAGASPRPDYYQAGLEWQGPAQQALQGRRILVYAEQGMGDVIQFVRYLGLLQRDGATVYCAVPVPLIPLVESMSGIQCVKPGLEGRIDHHVALLDLPGHYGTTLHTVPARVPYLWADAGRVAHWRERLRPWDGRFKVGIAWAGQPAQVNDRNRSMPLSEFAPLLALDGVQCFSLQRSASERFTDLAVVPEALVDFTAQWQDFADSAAMVCNLDLVISVDSAAAHLAGALGRPVWTVLAPNADWRWLLEREDSPWYPTMRLFRRGFGETRAAQMQRVMQALTRRLGA